MIFCVFVRVGFSIFEFYASFLFWSWRMRSVLGISNFVGEGGRVIFYLNRDKIEGEFF